MNNVHEIEFRIEDEFAPNPGRCPNGREPGLKPKSKLHPELGLIALGPLHPAIVNVESIKRIKVVPRGNRLANSKGIIPEPQVRKGLKTTNRIYPDTDERHNRDRHGEKALGQLGLHLEQRHLVGKEIRFTPGKQLSPVRQVEDVQLEPIPRGGARSHTTTFLYSGPPIFQI